MKKIILLIILVSFTSLNSCNSKISEEAVEEEVFAVDMSALQAPPPQAAKVSEVKFVKPQVVDNEDSSGEKDSKSENIDISRAIQKKKIIKDGRISVKTDDINASKKSIDNLLKNFNAYYESEDLENNDDRISYDLTIRVPANNFEKLITGIENGKDELKSKSIQARDVTEEYVDIETRLINKREYLKRYRQLLSKASTVKDILAIEENIRILQEEIESKEGRLKYLNDQVDFSTLNLNLYKEKEFVYKPQPQDKFSERVKKSLSNGWTSVVDFMLWIIKIWPLLIIVPVCFFIFRRVIRRRKGNK